MPRFRPYRVGLLLVAVFLTAGCQNAEPVTEVDHLPQLDADGQRRAVVLDTMLLDYLKQRSGIVDGDQWYDGRNDLSPAAFGGYDYAAGERSLTITRDHQHQTGGRVHDHFNSTTYRREYRESSR